MATNLVCEQSDLRTYEVRLGRKVVKHCIDRRATRVGSRWYIDPYLYLADSGKGGVCHQQLLTPLGRAITVGIRDVPGLITALCNGCSILLILRSGFDRDETLTQILDIIRDKTESDLAKTPAQFEHQGRALQVA